MKGDIDSVTGFDEPRLSTRFIIEHGVNRLTFETPMTYTRCTPKPAPVTVTLTHKTA